MKWLRDNFGKAIFEIGCKQGRLDAALWFEKIDGTSSDLADLAIEWEWDNNKALKNFPKGDFLKILSVPARAGLAIIQTRIDGKKGTIQAEKTLDEIKQRYIEYKEDNRPVGVIEIRRISSNCNQCEFVVCFHDFVDNSLKFKELKTLRYPNK